MLATMLSSLILPTPHKNRGEFRDTVVIHTGVDPLKILVL